MGDSDQKIELVEFLYKDHARLDSFFAQLYQGNLKEIAATSAVENNISRHVDGSIPPIIKGGYSGNEITTNTIGKKVDPHDSKILDIIKDVNIGPQTEILPKNLYGCLMILKGQIFIRNYVTVKDAIGGILGSETIMKTFMGSANPPNTPSDSRTRAEKQNERRMKKQQEESIKLGLNLANDMLKLIPFGLELQIKTDFGDKLVGIIKGEYLSSDPDDLLRIYGTEIPGEWSILGIIDSLDNIKYGIINPNNIRNMMDQYTDSIKALYSSPDLTHSITPIAIYRELNL